MKKFLGLEFLNLKKKKLADLSQFWNECCEKLVVARHLRNRTVGESVLKLKTEVIDLFNSKVEAEKIRFSSAQKKIRGQWAEIRGIWNLQLRNQFYDQNGIWPTEEFFIRHWIRSSHENFYRMRFHLEPNLDFDPHFQASRSRDSGEASNFVHFSDLLAINPPVRKHSVEEEEPLEEWEILPERSAFNK